MAEPENKTRWEELQESVSKAGPALGAHAREQRQPSEADDWALRNIFARLMGQPVQS